MIPNGPTWIYASSLAGINQHETRGMCWGWAGAVGYYSSRHCVISQNHCPGCWGEELMPIYLPPISASFTSFLSQACNSPTTTCTGVFRGRPGGHLLDASYWLVPDMVYTWCHLVWCESGRQSLQQNEVMVKVERPKGQKKKKSGKTWSIILSNS